MRHVALLVVALGFSACTAGGAPIEVGTVDQKAPKPADLKAPKGDEGVPVVGLTETIKGKVGKDEKRNLYVVVNPLSNPDTANAWWVQQEVSRDGEAFSATAQFGEGEAGRGEFFVVLAVATDKTWSVGEMLTGLPADAAYSRVKVIKRK